MSRYTITPAAKKDIKEIKDAIVSNNQEAARIFISELTQKFQTLTAFPEMGRLWDELVPPLRSFPIGRYLIFYRPVNNGIQIMRVVSGYRDLDAIFSERNDT